LPDVFGKIRVHSHPPQLQEVLHPPLFPRSFGVCHAGFGCDHDGDPETSRHIPRPK